MMTATIVIVMMSVSLFVFVMMFVVRRTRLVIVVMFLFVCATLMVVIVMMALMVFFAFAFRLFQQIFDQGMLSSSAFSKVSGFSSRISVVMRLAFGLIFRIKATLSFSLSSSTKSTLPTTIVLAYSI